MQLVRVDRKQGISDTAKYSIEKDGGKKSCSKKRQLFFCGGELSVKDNKSGKYT